MEQEGECVMYEPCPREEGGGTWAQTETDKERWMGGRTIRGGKRRRQRGVK